MGEATRAVLRRMSRTIPLAPQWALTWDQAMDCPSGPTGLDRHRVPDSRRHFPLDALGEEKGAPMDFRGRVHLGRGVFSVCFYIDLLATMYGFSTFGLQALLVYSHRHQLGVEQRAIAACACRAKIRASNNQGTSSASSTSIT